MIKYNSNQATIKKKLIEYFNMNTIDNNYDKHADAIIKMLLDFLNKEFRNDTPRNIKRVSS